MAAGNTDIIDALVPTEQFAGNGELLRIFEDQCAVVRGDADGPGVAGWRSRSRQDLFVLRLARRSWLAAVRFGEIRAPLVGEAERNMERARRTLRAMSPCVVLIDEADQAGLWT